MSNKNLWICTNSIGQKIKTAGLTINQNSSNNVLNWVTIGKVDSAIATFRTSDGRLSKPLHLTPQGKYTLGEELADGTNPDGSLVFLPMLTENADNLYLYTLKIPFGITSMLVASNTARLSVAITSFTYDSRTQVLDQRAVANSQIVVNRSDDSEYTDEQYADDLEVDIENLWKSVGDLQFRYDLVNDMVFSNVPASSDLILKNITVGNDTWIIPGSDGSMPKLDAFDIVSLFKNPESHTPLSPIDSTVIVDIAEDNEHIEAHLDKHFLDAIDIEVPLAVKRPDSNKQRYTLDGAEVELLKGLRFWYEYNLFGETCVQCLEIHFAKVPTQANLIVGPTMADPAFFKDTIVPVYDKTTNELYIETSGSSVSEDIKIIDVVGLL